MNALALTQERAKTVLHLITCETRPARQDGLQPRDLQLRTLLRLESSSIVQRNLCECKQPRPGCSGDYFGLFKPRAVALYASRLPPNDLLMFLDSDVLINWRDRRRTGNHLAGLGRSSFAQAVVRRFEVARRGRAVVFQSEPFCQAPTLANTAYVPRGLRKLPNPKAVIIEREFAGCHPSVFDSYAAMRATATPWFCPRFLNSGAYIGAAGAVAKLTQLWSDPRPWAAECQKRPRWGWNDQCIATRIYLQQNVSIELDHRELLFATATRAVRLPKVRGRLKPFPRTSKVIQGCGDVPCGCNKSLSWHSGELGILHRDADYCNACQATTEPLLIHFNGNCKSDLIRDLAAAGWPPKARAAVAQALPSPNESHMHRKPVSLRTP